MHTLIVTGGVTTAAVFAYHYGKAYFEKGAERIVSLYEEAKAKIAAEAVSLRAEAERLEKLVGISK